MISPKSLQSISRILRPALTVCAVFLTLLMLYCIALGIPPEIGGHVLLKTKNLKGLTALLVLCFLLRAALAEEGPRAGLEQWGRKAANWMAKPSSACLLITAFAVLFTWQQVTEYLSIKINFLPFSFYDYMLLYFFKGKIYFTNLLHGFYHANTALFLFAPLWKAFPDSLLLILIYGPLAALAGIPLYYLTAEKMDGNRTAAFITVLVYFNYRHLQNVLQMNFSIEILYPFFFFTALWAALTHRWISYYLAVLLGLSVKEDSFIYFLGFAGFIFFQPDHEKRGNYKVHAILTAVLAAGYYALLSRVILPAVGSPILSDVMKNFDGAKEAQSGNVAGVAMGLLKNPLRIIQIYTDSPEKWKTYLELLSRLCFIPLFSPASLIILAPLFPLFFHATGRDTDFISLHYHYAAPVIPFVFMAFVYGLSSFLKKMPAMWRSQALFALLLGLFFLNVGYFRTEKITPENLKSIAWAKEIPQNTNLVTHGHLLPYIGYRELNYYLADPFELTDHPQHEPYMNADFYLFDKNVNPYPWGPGEIEAKIEALKQDSRYEIIKTDGTRILFKRKNNAA